MGELAWSGAAGFVDTEWSEVSQLGLKRLAQRRLRQVLLLFDEDDPAELGQAFELIGAAESAIGQIRKCVDGACELAVA